MVSILKKVLCAIFIVLPSLFVLLWVGSFLVVYLFTHPPSPAYEVTPKDYGLDYEELHFKSTDSVTLLGWYMPAEEEQGLVVIAGGFRDSKERMLGHVAFLHQAGYSCVVFDYRSVRQGFFAHLTFGANERKDLLGLTRYLEGGGCFGYDGYFIIGLSMGAATTIMSVREMVALTGVVLNSSFADMGLVLDGAVAGMGLPVGLFSPLLRAVFHLQTGVAVGDIEPKDYISDLSVPMLIIHGQDDFMVSPAHGEELYSLAPDGAEIWRVPGAGHIIVKRELLDIKNEEYKGRIVDFLFGVDS